MITPICNKNLLNRKHPNVEKKMAEARPTVSNSACRSTVNGQNCRVVIIADSRGVGLQSEFDLLNDKGYEIKVLVYKGRGMSQAVREATNKLIWMRPDQIIILAGICDITRKDRDTKLVSLQDGSVDVALERLENSMKEIEHHLTTRLTERPYTLTFSPVTGMDIARYNGQDTTHEEQETLNEIIGGINQIITAHNKANRVITPWIASEIHYNKKGGRKKTRYYKLAADGLHLSDAIKERWAGILYTAIVKMVEDPPQ